MRTQPAVLEGETVVAGRYGRFPTAVRFSPDPNKPPLVIQMEIPLLPWLNAGKFTTGQQAYFSFSVAPRDSVVKERGTILPTGNQALDTRFVTRCDNPTGAKTFVQDRQMQEELQKLCCSPKTALRINGVNMELSEMAGGQNGRHILAHLESMAKLAGGTGPAAAKPATTTAGMKLPTTVTLPKVPMPKFLGERGPVILAGVIALVIVAVVAWNYLRVDEEEAGHPPAGVAASDLPLIPDANHWALVEDKDLSPAGLDWVRRQGATPTARINADFAGGGSADTAYVLKRRGGMLRVVMLSKGKNRYDTNFSPLALVARIPKATLDSLQWPDPLPATPDGDGLLLVRKADDSNTALIVMFSGARTFTARPPDYRELRLQ